MSRIAVVLAGLAVLVGVVVAAPGAGAAGKPAPKNDLLCGTVKMPGMDRFSGASDIDHPHGRVVSGNEYPNSPDIGSPNPCGNKNRNGTDFTWTLTHSNVDVVKEKGTEHGVFTLSSNGNRPAGFNGRITEYDFPTMPPMAPTDPDRCGNRDIYYASGHISSGGYDPCPPIPPTVGNFNTHGGANTDQHYRGQYGTYVYQEDNNNDCPSGDATRYCFEAILKGQQN